MAIYNKINVPSELKSHFGELKVSNFKKWGRGDSTFINTRMTE